MQVHIVKTEKESNERCITRFNKAVQASRKMPKIRGSRYHKPKPTKRVARAGAVMREYHRARKSKNKFYQ